MARRSFVSSLATRGAVAAAAIIEVVASIAPVVFVAHLAFGASRAVALDLGAEARRIVGAGQGVHVETEDGRVLASEAASRAVHPASVSKIATTLALLQKLGPDHRFDTAFLAGGPIAGERLEGPLVVRANGDPYFVDENALLAVRALQGLGLRTVAGELVVEGRMLFDWKADALAPRLRRALEGRVPPAAWQAVRSRAADAASAGSSSARGAIPALRFDPRAARTATTARQNAAPPIPTRSHPRLLVTHRSQPLRYMLKALNGYSNNIFAPFADAAGGIRSVESRIRRELPEGWRNELILGDGAGAHSANRMSPRATVAILRRLSKALAAHQLDLSDVMPVAGVDEGTLKERLSSTEHAGIVVAKTGTYGDYGACALAGALRTKTYGLVYFAILNHKVPIEEGRRRQDAFVRTLIGELGGEPWGYTRDDAPAFTRAQIELAATPTPTQKSGTPAR